MDNPNVRKTLTVNLTEELEHFSTAPRGILKHRIHKLIKCRIQKSLTVESKNQKKVTFVDTSKCLPLCTVFEIDTIKIDCKKKENTSCACVVF